MSSPRRASLDTSDEVIEAVVAPRRGVVDDVSDAAAPAPRNRWVRSVVAPVAIVGAFAMLVVGAVFGPKDAPAEAIPQPVFSVVERSNNIARSQQRPALSVDATPSASASPSETPTVTPTPSVTPSVSAEPSVAPTTEAAAPATTAVPAFDPRALAEAKGPAWVTANVYARTAPSVDADSLRVLEEGTKVQLTALTRDGWQQISLNDKAAWVSAKYLTTQAPASPTAKATTSGGSGSSDNSGSSSSGGFSTAPCQHSSGIESGLTSQTRTVFRAVCGRFPSITNYGGYRPDGGYHGRGQAIDVMISGDAGWTVANWVRANASQLGVTEVIYAQKIWTTQRSGEGWRSMSNRGSATANHYDHVHITVGR